MAYQPKYARNQKKPASSPLMLGLSVLIVPLSLALSFLLLKQVFYSTGTAAAAASAQPKTPDTVILEQFDPHMDAELEKVKNALTTLEKPEDVVVTEATVPPYEAVYTLDDATQVAPAPNPACFGQSNDPAVLADVVKQAQYILDGQSLYFHPDVELFPDSVVNYYLDESIFAITWKEVHNGSVYTFSEVKLGHPSQLRRHLSDGAYGSGKTYLPTEMATTVNAVVATSGDFYANRPIFGIVAYEGQVRRSVDDGYAETCYIDDQGDLIFSYMKQLKSTQNAQAFLEENNIRFSLAFGPILVDNYEVKELPNVYGVGEIKEEYARSALCQMDKLHYLVAIANIEGDQQKVPNVASFQEVIATLGCKMAYCLDGGQTAAIVMNNQLINRPAKGEQRRISDIIYFATAVPEGG